MYTFICLSKMEEASGSAIECSAMFTQATPHEEPSITAAGAFMVPVTFALFQRLEVGKLYTLEFQKVEGP